MDKWQALNTFFNQFGCKAYETGTVPKDAGFPRITYESRIASLGEDVQIDASVWNLSNSWAGNDEIVQAIDEYIQASGCPVIEGGRFRVYKGTPFAQRMSDPENENIRRTVLHINFEFMTL